MRVLLPAALAALVIVTSAVPVGATGVNQAAAPPPPPPPPISSGVTSGYAIASPSVEHSPLGLAPRVAAGARPTVARPHLRIPRTGAAPGQQSTSPSAPVHTITSVSPAPKTAGPRAAAGIGPLFSTLITHDSQLAFNGLDVAPPDTQLAAGPTAWLEAVNDMAIIRSRFMTPGGDFDLNAFFKVPSGFLFTDPKVIYERVTGRWYVSGVSFDRNYNSYVYLAVSSSSEPSGAWTIYTILDLHTAGLLCDQPHLGFSDDKVVVACDEFNASAQFVQAVFMVLDKAGLLSGGNAAEFVNPFSDAAHSSLQPAYSMTSTATQYVTYLWSSSPPTPTYAAGLLAIVGNPARGNISWKDTQSTLSITPFATTIPRAPQNGTTSTLDTGDLRFLGAVYRSGIIWTSAGDGCIPAGDTVQRACLRLVQLNTGSWPSTGQPTRTQDYNVSMVVAGSSKYLFFPAVTMDASGTTYVAYSMSSAADLPQVLASDILPGLPGAIDQTFQLSGSAGAYAGPILPVEGGSRWGDYNSAAPDPNDPHTVLVAGEISAFEMSHANDWGTAGNTLSIPGCSSVNIGFATQFMPPIYPGAIVTVGASASGCSGTPQFLYWKQPPGGAWAIVQDYSATNTYSWDTGKETVLGAYKWEIDARSQGFINSYDTIATATFTLAGPATCPNTVTFTPSSPTGTGTAVVIQASSTCPDPMYRFWIRPPGGSWSVVQGYSKTSSYNWIASGAGTYSIEVDVKERLDPASFYGYPTNLTYVRQACSSAGISASPASPRAPGGTVVVTGSATCFGTPTYRFWVRTPGGAWSIAQDFSTSNTYNWPTTGLAMGSYSLEVDVRNQNTTISYETVGLASYFLSTAACAPSLTASPPSPGATGAAVTFNAIATGCPNPRYRFWVQPPGGPWRMVQDYSAASSYVMSGMGPPGSYHVEVDTRDQSESVAYDAVAIITYWVNPCTAAGLSANPPSPHAPGGAVVLTGTSTCAGTPMYKFWVRPPGGAWSVVQDYSTASTFSWQTTGLAVGTYGLEVDVRNQGSSNTYEAVGSLSYVVGVAPCSAVIINPAPPAAPTTSVQFSANATGCANPVYRFWIKPPGGAWSIAQDWGTALFMWTATNPGGTYGVEVDARDQNETTLYDVVANTTMLVTPCSSVALDANPPGPAGRGSTVILTATGYCPNGGQPNYRFWIKAPYGSWFVVQDYPTLLNNYRWDTSRLDPGTYTIEVDVRNQGVNDSYEAVTTYTYVVT